MNKIMVEYIWIDGAGNTRSKTKVDCNPKYNVESLNDLLSLLPQWNYDGSSTNQATTEWLGFVQNWWGGKNIEIL